VKTALGTLENVALMLMTQKPKDITSTLPVDPAGVAESVEFKGVSKGP
jgi:hypothetical protein